MKYRVLLCGKSKSIIDDFFVHLEMEFEAQTTSLRHADFISHLKYFEPAAVVFCIHKESPNAINSMVAFMDELESRRIPLIIIGNTIECQEFQKATCYMAKLVLKKPMRINTIGEKIKDLLERPKYKKEFEANNEEENSPSLDEEILQEEKDEEILQTEEGEEISQVVQAKEVSQNEESGEVLEVEESNEVPQVEKSEEVPQVEKSEEIPQTKKGEEMQPVKKHVLVVDDDPMMLRLIKEQLKDNYAVATAINGNLALKFLENKKTDLIILDYEMPNENGAEVLKKIRDNDMTANIPVVFLTGISDREKIQKVLKFKPQGYLLKPIEREKLLQIIANTIG